MRDLAALGALYGEIDVYFEGILSAAAQRGGRSSSDRVEEQQRLNDQAYFVLCWGQLEAAIDTACRAAIRKRLDSADWNSRRAWDRYNPDDKRLSGLPFDERAALVLDRQGGRGSPWARTMDFYAIRNQIAHGILRSDRIDVTAVIAQFYQIQGGLTA